ncbi:DUF421 domain-containing protein [Algoriphagus sp. D3-2-R+10]|uniref:DUF421 domain-containing protein n=1 Tax=Algoriphagus aurantiacus TaxID=3103948 RepID=UPI002B3CB52B|nr:YetF domain-containing protein [Algoriphagus sp. D3-2-R+10]MEB2777832.1 DUF421 domain-containing protein [Algoriphagus sp. D3-2-R+10]
MENIWFDSWESILRIILVTPLAYFTMVLILRISGKRTLSKMNAFDFVVTIALGSTLASVALIQNIPYANGITAILVFIGLQFIFTWLSVRVRAVKTLITSRPSLIFYKGEFLNQAMKKERITVEEIYSAARQKGLSTLDGIDMIIFETTGDISIIEKITDNTETTYQDVKIKP